jgi:hypothetical protein
MNDDIIRLPPTDKWLGSCPECGRPIWDSYAIHKESENLKAVYRCIECKTIVLKEAIIPF